MIFLLISMAVLLAGFLVYGRITERVFAPDDRETPAVMINDGVDCVPMKPWKAFLIQLLNIAGTGPMWRYFSWSNQTLAMISLWVATAWLLKEGRKRIVTLMTALPAAFMSAVSMTYILMAEEGFGLSAAAACPAGAAFAAVLFILYLVISRRK